MSEAGREQEEEKRRKKRGLMHPNEEMIHSDAELMCGRVSFHPHRVVSVYIRGMEPNHFHPRPLPPDSSLSRCSVSPGPAQPTGPLSTPHRLGSHHGWLSLSPSLPLSPLSPSLSPGFRELPHAASSLWHVVSRSSPVRGRYTLFSPALRTRETERERETESEREFSVF